MNKKFWKDKRVLVTGGHGFVGTHLVNILKTAELKELRLPSSKEFDLREKAACSQVVKDMDIVIHLAANVGGIGYNQQFPGTLFYDNLLMGVHLLEEAREANVNKFVAIGTICAYPKHTPIPFQESELWNGYPEETNAPYGLAKKMMLVQSQAYRQQYDFNSIFLLPVNMYGPGDNFDPGSSHVIPALIKKFVDATQSGAKEVSIWGTGSPTREFLYVTDAAEAILLASEKYNKSDPINLGSSTEISIKELAEKISNLIGFKGQLVFDRTKPDGQPRRKLDVTNAKKEFDFTSSTSFNEGLKKTIEWYQKQA
jgi:GDP-L-fucose synthase